MLEIKTKHLQPDIVVLEIAGRITIGRDCQHVEWAVDHRVLVATSHFQNGGKRKTLLTLCNALRTRCLKP